MGSKEGSRPVRMSNPRWRQSAALSVCATMMVLAGCGAGDTETGASAEGDPQGPASCDGATITVGQLAGGQALTTGFPVTLASELGLFKDQGLTVETVDFTTGGDVINGLISGELDVAHMGSEGIVAAAQGADTIGIATLVDRSVFSLVGAPDSTWDSLEGATVGTSGLTTIPTVITSELLRQAGYNVKDDFEFVTAGSTPQTFEALLAGQVDLIPSSAPFTFMAEDKGYNVLGYVAPGGEPIDINATNITSTGSFTKEHPEVAVCYLRAMLNVSAWVHDSGNREEFVRLLEKLGELEPSVAERSAELYLDSDIFADYYLPTDLKFNPDSISNAADAYVEIGAIEEPIPSDQFIDETLLDQAMEGLE